MKGGLNKILRNVVATKGKSEFDKRLIKATYHLDSKEPKEKHVIYIIESIRGSNPELPPQEALNRILARFLKNISSWSLTTKIFIIFHRCLREPQLAKVLAQELKQKEHLMHSFQKKASDQTYDAQMYADLSQLYANYIKYLVSFKVKSDLLNLKMTEVSGKVKQIHTIDLLYNYENFDGLIQQIFGIFEHQNFCKKTRLWTNVILQLFLDLIQIYKCFYILITEVLDRFPELTKDQSQKFLVIYQNFVNFTKILKSKGSVIQSEFGFHISLPKYYDPDPEMIETLQVCIMEKESNSHGLQKASQNLRNGMNRNEFDTVAPPQHRDTFFDNPNVGANKIVKMKEEESDSGEDFDYDEEDDESDKNQNNDFLNYITNMDLSHIDQQNQANKKQQDTNDFFNFDFNQQSSQSTAQKQKPAQQNQTNDIFSLLEAPTQNTQPNIQKSQSASVPGKDPFAFDLDKPLIPSNPSQYSQQSNQIEMFKNLYSNLPQQTIQPVQQQNPFNFNQQQIPNQFVSNYGQPNAFQSMNPQNAFVSQQQPNMMGGGMYGNQNLMGSQMIGFNGMNSQQMMGAPQQQQNPYMQNQGNNQFISQQPFMSVSSTFSNMTEVQQQNPNSKEFTFW